MQVNLVWTFSSWNFLFLLIDSRKSVCNDYAPLAFHVFGVRMVVAKKSQACIQIEKMNMQRDSKKNDQLLLFSNATAIRKNAIVHVASYKPISDIGYSVFRHLGEKKCNVQPNSINQYLRTCLLNRFL